MRVNLKSLIKKMMTISRKFKLMSKNKHLKILKVKLIAKTKVREGLINPAITMIMTLLKQSQLMSMSTKAK